MGMVWNGDGMEILLVEYKGASYIKYVHMHDRVILCGAIFRGAAFSSTIGS